MRFDGFGRTLFFGFMSALGLPAAWVLLGPLFGGRVVVTGYLAGVAILYAAGIAPPWRRGLPVALLVGVLAAPLFLAADSLAQVGVLAALLAALCRGTLLRRERQVRGLAIEAGLTLFGLGLAGLLAGPGPAGIALGIWGYFLIQSLFFLIEPRPTGALRERPDPFDEASTRLRRLLADLEARPAKRIS